MAGRFVGFGKKLFDLAKKRGEKSSTVTTIVGVAPKVPKSKIGKAMSDLNKTTRSAIGRMKKGSQDFDRDIRKVQTRIGQTSQKLKGEPVTKSGFTKGKDLKKVEKKANGGRIGRRFGSPKPKTSVDKIKETFSPKGTNLKPVDPKKQKGLSKLPKQVRNKMGYMKKGGVV
jgi:hypothetical protein